MAVRVRRTVCHNRVEYPVVGLRGIPVRDFKKRRANRNLKLRVVAYFHCLVEPRYRRLFPLQLLRVGRPVKRKRRAVLERIRHR